VRILLLVSQLSVPDPFSKIEKPEVSARYISQSLIEKKDTDIPILLFSRFW
jgi:hypothetical protein